ncbi:Ig-like domain-containing protein [Citrobacter amalonaticus]|nr:Ig-like domain-containing protein [Citrobacter amalonaticus]MDL4620142.1 Ig-like domain-containing protein [Citrobacter amalonaticus]MDL4624240.1 Ig-like domain-containing protein [Citrobacter amalonaticus]
MNTLKTANIINRHTAKKTVLSGEGNLSVAVSGASIIEILGSAQDVARYVRQGNDLLIYMKDGSVIRCSGYFTEEPESKLHSELVFSDETGLTHVTFDETGDIASLDAVELTAHETPVDSLEPLMAEAASEDNDFPWAWLAGAGLGGGAIGALLANDDGGKTKTVTETQTEVVDNTKNTPTYMVTDKKGDKQGGLSANATTDDNTPTFSGTGHPGATIQIKDSHGNTIASTMVDANGVWTVLLPVQTDGTHTWSVVQINGNDTTSAGSITINVDTTIATLTLATTAGDNIVNASEQSAGFTLSGASSHLAQGTALTVTLNGKTYVTTVGANGEWQVNVPAADANALADGSWTVAVSGQNAAGNAVSGSQIITVDTQPPLLSMDKIAIDQIINAAEHNASLVLSGKTTAEAGQTITLMFNGKTYTATVAADGTWSMTLGAADVQALADGNHSLTVSVNDKAGNTTNISELVTVDTTAPILTVNTVAGDNILNDDEQDVAQLISGMANGAAPGDVVTVQFGNQTFTGVVQADGSWSVGVPASVFNSMSNGQHTITVTVTDAAGNTSTATHDVTLNSIAVGITVDPISVDNVLNAQESMQPLTLSGTSTLADGSTVTVMLNNIAYTATVNNGTWSVQVPVSDVLNLANTIYNVTVSGTDSIGNSGTTTASFLVDTTLPQVIINNFATDNLVNNTEANSDQILSGRVTNAAAGDTVSIMVGGKHYTATVENDLSWKVTIPASDLNSFGDGDLTFTASVTNSHGNTGTGDRDININASLPGLRINTLSGDDIVNAIEQHQDLVVTGSSSHLAAGTTINVTINNVTYQTVVDSSGNWQIGVPAADLQSWTAGQVVVNASAQDAWANTVTVDHQVELDLDPVAISIDTLSTDDLINSAEKGADLLISGQTQGVEAGQTVVVKFAGQTFTALVQGDGSWSVTVPPSAIASLTDSREQISVSVTNASGNTADAGRTVTLDTSAPLITIDTIAADDILNATESLADLVITGTTTAPAGQTVTVMINGNSYTALVQANGTWSVTVPTGSVYSIMAVAGVLTTGTVTATVSDTAGNTGSASHALTVDTTSPVVTINTVAADDIINRAEHGQTQIISGSASGAAAGDAVTVTVNGKDYTTVVDAAGNWSVGVPPADISGLNDGTTTIAVTVTNAAGNSGSATHDVTVDTAAPSVTVGSVTADDVINAAEQGADLVLSGTTTNVEAGQLVTVTLNGQTYTAQVQANGEWTLTVPSADLSGLSDGSARVEVSVSNAAGNSASATHDYSVDTTAPVITISTIAADDILNASEAQADLVITGTTTAPAGQTVTVTINGNSYTALVQANGSWSVTVPAAAAGALTSGNVTATVSDAAGNTGSASHALTVDTTSPVVTINTVASDDIINRAEHGQTQIISGSASGAAAGDAVTVTVNGKNYTTVVDAAGNWSVGVPATDISALNDGTTTIAVTVTNAAGNSGSATHDVTVDTAAPSVTVGSVTADDVINAAEQGADLVLSGTTTNVEAGQTVTVMFNGRPYTATVDNNGEWTLTVPSADLAGITDGSARVEVSVSNAAGNSASATHDYSVDTTAPVITISTIAADDILNATEAQADLVITGTTTAPAGQTVTVMLNGNSYTALVQANGNWSVTVPAAEAGALTSGSVTATVSDAAGNTGSASHALTVDTTSPVVTISTVAADDIINSAEHGQTQIISGSASGAAAGDAVTVTVNGKNYTTVVDAAGNWSVGVPAADISALNDGVNTISVTVTNAAGNSGSATHDVTVDTAAPSVTVGSVTADDVINAAEQGADLVLSGTTTNVEAGQTVTVMFNGRPYTVTVDNNGEWTLTVPPADLAGITDGSARVEVSVSNAAGNSASATHDYSVDTTAPVITISTIAADDILNATEAQADLVITGTTTAPAGQTVTVMLNGNSYTALVQANGSWSVTVPAAEAGALTSGNVTATVSDSAGNTGSASHALTVDTTSPVVTISTVAADDIINSAEHGQTQIISGSASGAAAGDAVTVTVNGKDYTTVVDAAGNWSVGVPAADISGLNDGVNTISVTVTSAAGNSGSATHDVTVDTATPSVTVSSVTADDVINAAEQGADLVLSGTTTNVEAGQLVTVILNGQTYTAQVQANGEWTLTVPSADLAGITDGSARVEVSVSNAAGNSASATHDYSVDTTAPAITISTLAADDILNATESLADLVISGTTTAPAGQTVTVTINGNDYTALVQVSGSWSVTVPAAEAGALTSGNVTATVSDTAGNTGSASHALTVDTTSPVVTISTVASDDIINSAEHGQTQIISGSASGAAAGDAVTVTVNGKDYTTVVDAAGNWSVGVPAADISALNDGTTTIAVTVTNAAGNSGSATHDVEVNTATVTLAVDTIAVDDVINALEAGSYLTISGTSGQLPAGTIVTVMLNGQSYTATVQANGTWTATVPAADVAQLGDGQRYTVSVTAQDSAGNSASASSLVSVDTSAPVVTINTISADDVLNAAEQQQPLVIQGNTSAEPGQVVTITAGGQSWTAVVAADGSWSVTVPAADLAGLNEGALMVTATVSDKAGNESQTTHNVTVDTTAPLITIDTVASDDIVNTGEQRAGQTISGTTTAEPGQTVTVTFNGHSYQATVDASGNWSVFVPATDFNGLVDGNYTITATVNDAAGNAGGTSHNVTLNGDVPTITINTLSTDDIINAAEHGTSLILSGTTTAPAGQTVTITLNGQTYTAVVDSNGQWSCVVGSADVAALADGTAYTVHAEVSNAIGNSASDDHSINVDLAAPAQIITIVAVQNDTGLSASDFITSDNQIVLDGSLSTTLATGETAQISLDGGATWIDLVVNGTSWSYADGRTLADGSYQYLVRVIDAAGNVGTVVSQTVVVDTTPSAVTLISVDSITQDSGLSTSDFITSDNQLTVQGSLNAPLASGEHVQISLDGGNTWIDVSVSGQNWSYADGRTLADGDYVYQLRVIDDAGNVSATTSQTVTIDMQAPDASKTIVFDSITDDSGLSNTDFLTNDTSLSLKGTLGATLAADETVQISLDGGATWQNVTVIGNSWTFDDGRTLAEGTYDYWVRVIDTAGNVGETAHQQVTIDLTPPDAATTVTVDRISSDTGADNNDFLTQSRVFTVEGSLGAPLAAGEVVQISLDNGVTWITTTVTGTQWHYDDNRILADGDYLYMLRVVDAAGNVGATTSQRVTVDNDVSWPTIQFDSVSNDTGVSGSDFITSDTTLTIQGSLSKALRGDEHLMISVDGGATWVEATVNGTGWSFTDPRVLADGDHTWQVKVVDDAGNMGGAVSSVTVTVDTTPPVITLNTVAFDDVVNTAEQQAGQTISGTSDAGQGSIVTVTFNGHSYLATVDASGNWSVLVPASDFNGLPDGDYTIKATVNDKAGNTVDINHDVTLSREVPTITIDTLSMDDVINAAEHGVPLTISGTTNAPVGQMVTITLGGKTYHAVVDSNGQWSCVVSSTDVAALVDGTAYIVNAEVSNAIGNSSNSMHVVNVDLTAPGQTISIDSVQGDSGLSASDFVTNTNQVVLEGSLSAPLGSGETAQISLDGGATWIDLVVNGSSWSYADGRTLADGSYQYLVRVIDAAGNVGPLDSQAIRVDTTPPAVTLISVDSITQDTGLSTSDFITHDNQLALHGSLNAVLASGEHVQISLDGGLTWIDVSVSGQSWSYADGRTLADGDYVYQLRVIDDAGNVSATTNQTVTIDTQVPDASKTIVFDSISDDSGLSSSDFITKDTSLSLQGSLGATLALGEIVQISLDGGATWQNVTVIGSNWFFDDGRTLAEGTYDYWVRVIDTAGNIGSTAHQQVTVDLTPPDSAITVSIDSISTDTGYSSTDWLTNDTSLTIKGSIAAPLAAGDRVQISVDNGVTWQDVIMNGTDWSYVDSRTLVEGDHTYQVRVVDVAGNVGATNDQIVTVDLTPSATTATIVSYTDDVASSRGDFASGTTTDDRTPVLNGTLSTTLQTGELVRIYSADGTLLGEADVNGTDWTYQLNVPLVDGEKGEFYAVVVDAAGNEGTHSPVFDFTVDLVMYADTQSTLDTTPIITGSVDFEILPGEYVEVTVNNVVYSSRNGAVVIDPKNSTWYVQIPDSDALALGTYDVKAVLYKADGTEITKDDSSNELTVAATPSISFTSTAASSQDTGTALTMSEDGTWRILSNSTVFTQNATDSTTLGSFNSVAISGPDKQQQSSFVDFDRDGLMDILGADTGYANGQQSFKYNEDGTYTSFQVGAYGVTGQTNDPNGNVYGWYGGAMGIDINGDGYVDMVYGDETPNDSETRGGYDTGFVINTDGTIIGFDKSGAYVYSGGSQDGVASTNNNNPTPDREVSGVDLNNDGYVDITYHATTGTNTTSGGGTSSSNSRLAIVTNGVDGNGNMTLTNTQTVTDVFYGNNDYDNQYTTMTWSDLNGDGYMDLFVAGLTGQGNATSAIFYNDGTGKLTTAANGTGTGSNVQTLGDSVNSMTSLAVDWNGDGKMDLIEIAGAAGSTVTTNTNNIGLLWTNNGVNGSNQVDWTSQTLLTGANQGSTNITTGALTLDLDYDGDKDLVVFRAAGGKTEYITNNSTIADGTSIILRISDANGINAFYGNTVLLIDESTGKVVSSQVINPQGGVNMNDSSGMVYFYGLDASKSYSAVLLASGKDYGGVSSVNFDSSGVSNTIENVNAAWGGLKAVEKNHAYTLTAEDGASAMNSATAATDGTNTTGIVGTGYNDTLYATAGTHVYNGGGGSRVVSDADVWTAQGGMDIVDYELAGSSALNIDLSNTGMQNTGFGNAQFVNVEGIAGGNGNDVFTGNATENFFEGRGGDDTFNIGNGGQDTLLYKLINASDATGGNGSDVVNGFTIGTWEGTADTDRIDLRELLSGSGYTGSGTASYVNSVATLDAQAGNIEDYVRVVQNGSNTEIHVDLDGAGGNFSSTNVVTLNGVQTDLATLLANHQLVIM